MTDSENKLSDTAVASSDFTGVLEQTKSEPARPEMSAAAVARMMGVATSTELKLLEGKLDLISNRVNHLSVRFDKILSQFSSLPTGSDMERIDVQIGSLKTIMRDLTVLVSGEPVAANRSPAQPATTAKQTEIVEQAEETPAAE